MDEPEAKPSARIVLGITGGVAAYKAPEIARRLIEGGATVQVVMTRSAQRFVGAAALQAVTGRPVRDDLFDAAAEAAMGHIELARWADQVIVAPATGARRSRVRSRPRIVAPRAGSSRSSTAPTTSTWTTIYRSL